MKEWTPGAMHFARANLRALLEAAMRGFGRAQDGDVSELKLLDIFLAELREQVDDFERRRKSLE